MEKFCTKCKFPLPLSSFNQEKRNLDGKTSACKSCISLSKKKYYANNKSLVISNRMDYYEKNKGKEQSYIAKRKKIDPAFRACSNARNRIFKLISGNQEYSTSIGCSQKELKAYIESKFQPGMTWANYGKWEIDHIYPLSKAHKVSAQKFAEACHYTNLQPLWSYQNKSKGATV